MHSDRNSDRAADQSLTSHHTHTYYTRLTQFLTLSLSPSLTLSLPLPLSLSFYLSRWIADGWSFLSPTAYLSDGKLIAGPFYLDMDPFSLGLSFCSIADSWTFLFGYGPFSLDIYLSPLDS
jgi:hypothetical protein